MANNNRCGSSAHPLWRTFPVYGVLLLSLRRCLPAANFRESPFPRTSMNKSLAGASDLSGWHHDGGCGSPRRRRIIREGGANLSMRAQPLPETIAAVLLALLGLATAQRSRS